MCQVWVRGQLVAEPTPGFCEDGFLVLPGFCCDCFCWWSLSTARASLILFISGHAARDGQHRAAGAAVRAARADEQDQRGSGGAQGPPAEAVAAEPGQHQEPVLAEPGRGLSHQLTSNPHLTHFIPQTPKNEKKRFLFLDLDRGPFIILK